MLAQSAWSITQIILAFAIVSDPKGAFDALTDFVVLGGTVFYALVVAAVIVLRFKRPLAERPYRVWLYPLTPLVYLAVAALVIVSSFARALAADASHAEQFQAPAILGLMIVGIGLYILFRRLESPAKS